MYTLYPALGGCFEERRRERRVVQQVSGFASHIYEFRSINSEFPRYNKSALAVNSNHVEMMSKRSISYPIKKKYSWRRNFVRIVLMGRRLEKPSLLVITEGLLYL